MSKGQKPDPQAKVLFPVLPSGHGHLKAVYPDRAITL